MANPNYKKGVRLEREVVQIFKDAGYVAQRTAGYHSDYDVMVIKKTRDSNKICFVFFVQCKVKKS